jgi:hypothetical protein
MEPIKYETACLEGGIHAFDDVVSHDQAEAETGSLRTPSETAAREYVRFLESAIESSRQALAGDEEAPLAA